MRTTSPLQKWRILILFGVTLTVTLGRITAVRKRATPPAAAPTPASQPAHRLAQPYLRFAKGPGLVPHQAENGHQLPLCELVFAETASVTREHCPGDLQGDASERQETGFGQRTSCLCSKELTQPVGYREFSYWLRGCQRSPVASSQMERRSPIGRVFA